MEGRHIARGSGLVRPDEALAAAGQGPRGTDRPSGRRPAEPAADDSDTEERPRIEPSSLTEDSGLHDIKALASNTKRRISQKISSENEAQESLLLSASSNALRAVALPDPTKEVAPAPIVRAKAEPAGAAPSRSSARRDAVAADHAAPVAVTTRESSGPAAGFGARIVEEQRSSAPWWIFGGVAVLAAAAAVAVFVFGVGRDKPVDETAATEPAPAASEAATATTTPGPVIASAQPLDPAAGAAPTAPPPASEPAGDDQADKGAASDVRAKSEGEVEEKADGDEKTPARADDTKDSKPSASEKKEAAGKDKKPGKQVTGDNLEDVLNQVTGGIDAPKEDTSKEPKKPSKKEIDRRDVSTAMGKVKSAVLKCRDVENYEGTVSVKFTVSPAGDIASVTAMGAKKGSPTGGCVESAVKKAKFPPFDGAPTSFTYPFLLAD